MYINLSLSLCIYIYIQIYGKYVYLYMYPAIKKFQLIDYIRYMHTYIHIKREAAVEEGVLIFPASVFTWLGKVYLHKE